jgi:hypothetical protein
MYYFEDENLDVFLVGDYQQTQITWGFNYTEEFYEEQEKTVKPDWRVKKWPTCHEFWESTEPKEFKIYYLRYSELHKFKRWLKVYVNSFDANVDKSMDQILDEKFGPMDDYTDYSMQRTNDSVPAIHHYGAKYFLEKDEKLTIYRDAFNPPKYISPNEGEMFDYEQYLKEEAQKGLKRVDQEMAGEEEKI